MVHSWIYLQLYLLLHSGAQLSLFFSVYFYKNVLLGERGGFTAKLSNHEISL